MKKNKYKTPDKLNLFISITQLVTVFLMMKLISHTDSTLMLVVYNIVFILALQAGYFLIHEAGHRQLHSNHFINENLGRLIASTFPTTYSFYREAHKSHHRNNRKDVELYDYVKPDESKAMKRFSHYLLLLGLQWVGQWLMSIIVFLTPQKILDKKKTFSNDPDDQTFFDFVLKVKKNTIIMEVLLCIAMFISSYYLLELNMERILISYLAFAFFYSSQQQIYHNRASRHIIEGTYNLRLPKPLQLVYLNSNFHLQHHRTPNVSWYYLDTLAQNETHAESFMKHYFRLFTPPPILPKEKYA